MELNEAGYPCSVKNMENLIYSDFSFSYHPIREYMNHLPQWDSIDHIGRLAESVHTIPAQREFWLKGFRHFLSRYGSRCHARRGSEPPLPPVMQQAEPGKRLSSTKSCQMTYEPIISAPASSPPATRTISPAWREFMLINFDEFEGMTGHELSLLKDLITRSLSASACLMPAIL